MDRMTAPLEQRLIEFSRDKAELLKLLIEKESREARKVKPYARGSSEAAARVPTSWAQQRLWFIDQLEGGTAAYNIPVGVRLRGALDQHALQNALDTIVQRHEVLRTVFVSEQGKPEQQISAAGRFVLQEIDLRESDDGERDAQLLGHEIEEAHGKFDLSSGPLIRGRLLRLHAEEHVLLVTMHHIVSDGWSMGVFFRELVDLYDAYRGQRGNPLEPLPIQYADYVQWQREWLRGAAFERQLNYWRARLDGAPTQLELPTDRPRPAIQSYRGENLQVALEGRLCGKLREFAHQHEMTLFMVLYAGWSILLSRLSGQDDIVIGTPIANRRRPELGGLIGFFVNTVVLRAGVHGELLLGEFLDHVKEVTLGAFDHQDVPFEKVVERLQPERSLSRNPLFQVMFALQNAPRNELQLSGLEVSLEGGVDEPAMFDLLVSLEERGDEIVGNVSYAADLFERETMRRWMTCFEVLLRDMTGGVPNRIRDLQILPESERHRVINVFNATQVTYQPEKLIHDIFEEQVKRTPDVAAILYGDQQLTYTQLNRSANQLARYLRTRGVGPDQPVGICVERSLEMVVGLLAILKAGGAYVPLDPNYPGERLRYMLEDAAPRLVLTRAQQKALLSATEADVIELGVKLKEVDGYMDDNLSAAQLTLTAKNLVYIIYTSGSTGRPKGTGMAHRSMVNLIEWHRQNLPVREGQRVLQFAALSFDVAFQEIFSTLCTGGTLVLLNEWIRRDVQALAEFLSNYSIERLFVPPLMLQSLAEYSNTTGVVPRSLKDIITAGEQLRIGPDVLGFFRKLRECRLYNHYGPTETHVVTAMALTGEAGNWPILPAIGRPIANTQIYVLDEQLRPVPIGVTSEIYIGGAGVARGYLNRRELTVERFIPDPFSSDKETRLYKTGDLGRWRADGMLEYLGRNDDQVKIRGFRIELGEVEAQLARHSAVKDAVVIVREDTPGEKRLVAYITRRDESSPSAEELRAHLVSVLPEHMVPSAFVVLETLPLTPNGKLNRRALPAPEQNAYVSRQYEAPQGQMEEILAGIWQELLGVQRVGRHDNFFELGGHSLLIVQLMERLRRVGLIADVRSVYESPTLVSLARLRSRAVFKESEVPPNLIRPGCESINPKMLPLVDLEQEQIDRIAQWVPDGMRNIQDIYPLAPLQEGMLFHYLLNDRGGDTYVVQMLLSLSSRGKLESFLQALQETVDRHDILRTAVLWEQLPQPVQVVYRAATLPVEEIALDRDRDPIEQIKERMAPELQRLNLRHAPLIRLQVALDPQSVRWYVILRLHHLICDHASIETMFAEVATLANGCGQELPEPMPYRNHVAQALSYSRTHDAEAFFRAKLGRIDEPTAPFGMLNVHGDGSQIEERCHRLEAALAQRVRAQARRMGVTAATLFHAVWALVVARTSGRNDVVYGTVLLGRLHGTAGAQRVLGMFMNTLPLPLRLGGVTAKELVEQTQRELVELLQHEQAPLAMAQHCSGIVGSAPLFSTLLNYRHNVMDVNDTCDSAGARFLAVQSVTNYPITLSVDDWGDAFALGIETDRRIDASRLMEYTRAAIESLVTALETLPQAPALTLSILPESERRLVLGSFNATQTPYPRDKLIHELFEEQVRRAPDAIAVVCERQSLTYAELDRRANQLAWRLRRKGIGPGELIGLYVGRGFELVIGLLGILKTGAAYVPLDPDYPPERVAYILEDAAPRLLLTQRRLKSTLLPIATETTELDSEWTETDELEERSHGLHPLRCTPQLLAYVIYTSGSTGNPKGVMIEHAALVNFLTSMQKNPGLSSTDCFLATTTISFDIAALEIYLALFSGAKLVLASRQTALDGRSMIRMLDEYDVTLLQATPATWQLLLSAGWSGRSKLKALCGGEALTADLSRKLINRVGSLWNLYGPTETTIWSCGRRIAEESDESVSVEPIGRPIANTRIYILDAQHQPVPIGVTGEIYIGGCGVARGYLNRSELTSERFLPDPFSADPGARMYKTGDLGSWRAEGTIEYLGRNDHQVKIRGFRIELGEIESQLVRHEHIKQAVVVAREDVPGEKRLVAYVTQLNDAALSAEEMRAQLKSVLPEYMVPSAFVMVDRLPLTPNGKLDRRALPVPEQRDCLSREYEAPQGEIEEILAAIWQQLLRVERVGRLDNFFELGGHSLHTLRLVVKVAEHFMVDLPVHAVFRYPTILQMAEAVTFRLAAEQLTNLAEAEFEEGLI